MSDLEQPMESPSGLELHPDPPPTARISKKVGLAVLGVVLPCGRHEHRERVPDVAPAAHEQLGRVVEHPRVGARLVERRSAVERAGPRAHPVHVAADRVDLAVVAQQPERLRALP